jgi:hypothetical protein
MSKNYLNKTTVEYNFPETEVIIEDFSLEFYKCELMQNKTKQKNETEISINNKNIIISVPKQIVGKDKNMIEKNKKISSPKKDVNMASPQQISNPTLKEMSLLSDHPKTILSLHKKIIEKMEKFLTPNNQTYSIQLPRRIILKNHLMKFL